MSLEAYKRNYNREKSTDKKLGNQEIIFGLDKNNIFPQKDLLNPLNRLTGNRGTSHSMPKNKNAIIHSNSTNQLNKSLMNNQSSLLKENNYNIININVNNLIINNNKEKINKDNKIFSKIGNDIIDGKINTKNDFKKNKLQL